MGSDPTAILPPARVLHDLVSWWKAFGTRGVLIGGIAAAFLGRPRVTRDVDAIVVLELNHLAAFLECGEQYGFVPRLSDAVDFAVRARVLLVKHEATAVDVDLSLAALPFEREAIENARHIEVEKTPVPFARPEDLIVMKAVAHRPRDWADVEGILASHPQLDMARVRRLVRQFAEAMEQPELVEELERVVQRTSSR